MISDHTAASLIVIRFPFMPEMMVEGLGGADLREPRIGLQAVTLVVASDWELRGIT